MFNDKMLGILQMTFKMQNEVFSKLILIIFEFVHHDLIDKLLLTALVGAEQATSLYLSEWRSRFWRHVALLSNNLLETVSMKIICKLFITLIFV